MNLVNVGKTYGVLRHVHSEIRIEYELYEISDQSVGILTAARLSIGDGLIIESHKHGSVPLMVLADAGPANELTGNRHRYRLICLQSELELSRLLEIDASFDRFRSAHNGQALQFARFSLDGSLDVLTKTFGSMEAYRLQGIDISKTGMLLCAKNSWDVAPFIEQTLLELKLDIGHKYTAKPLEPLGKVVRCFCKGKMLEKVRYYAIQFTDFGQGDTLEWEQLISQIETNSIDKARSQLAA